MIAKHLDLNLLMIFDAILAEGHVTRAAERLAMSQSAVSKGLAQLRQAFGDPLFLRASRGVVPTHRALEIADQVRQAIAALNSLAGPVTEFDARSAHAHFNIGATDYVSFVLLPGLMRRLQETAPHVSLTLHDMESMMPEEMLLAGKGRPRHLQRRQRQLPHLPPGAVPRSLRYCLCRAGHPALADPVPIEQFVSSRHLAMPRQNGARERVLQDTLQRLGVTRDVAVQVPHMLAIPATLTATDLVATMACRVAREFAARHPFAGPGSPAAPA